MKRLIQFSVSYPITISMIVLAVILLGYISFTKLGYGFVPRPEQSAAVHRAPIG